MKIIEFDEIDSTNKYLKEHYQNLPNFQVVSAFSQTNGKGREDRKWFSNKKENLLFSILIKEEKIIEKYKAISLLTAAVIRSFLESIGINNAMVKWPNDVYVNDKKICGVLLEGRLPEYLVIGIGLNVNQVMFNEEYRVAPTSISLEAGKNVEIKSVLIEILEKINCYIRGYLEGNYDLLQDIRSHNYLLGKYVSSHIDNKDISGVVIGISDTFSLLIENESGIIEIESGEIK